VKKIASSDRLNTVVPHDPKDLRPFNTREEALAYLCSNGIVPQYLVLPTVGGLWKITPDPTFKERRK
jgi:hypothetical protein